MKKTLTVIFCVAAAARLFADGTNVLTDEKARASYAIGMTLGHNWQQQGIDVDLDLVLRGLKDTQSGGATLLTPQEMQATLAEFQKNLAAKQQQMQKELAVKNKADGEAFLATNKDQPGVVTLPDGLQYKVITDGSGPMPAATDTVSVDYRGIFINGTEFDGSDRVGHPIQFQANRVIPGWTEALTHMKAGSKWRLFIPSELAYGPMGRSPRIPPNATLIFEVELLSFQPPATPPPAPVTQNSQPLTSDIIKVPSAEEMKKGAKIEVIKPEDAQKLGQSQTN
ncbi:MAG TPA: FKBP-type peptidyl-prolyl cis-trans isomerase [Verrucomicrobiae bacterium]|jgi:FKBP-type peptidyl-prolyl cis-trans isomerase